MVPGSGIITNDTSQSGLGQGSYKLIVTDINNCSDSATYDIIEPDTISISHTSTNVSCADSLNGTISQ